MENTFQVVDIVNAPEPRALALFREEIDKIRRFSTDRNRDNYQNLDRDYEKFECFHVLLQGNRLVGFSGVQPFAPNLSRVLSRTYYVPDSRHKALSLGSAPGYSTEHLLPLQVDFAKRAGKAAVFISVQGDTRRAFVLYLQRYMRKKYPDQDWEVLDDLYLTYPAADKNCWQNIALLKFRGDFEFPLPRIATEEWRARFFSADRPT